MAVLKSIRDAVKRATGNDGQNKRPAQAAMTGEQPTRKERGGKVNRQARGRDSTIITQRSEIGSRTLLG